MHFSINDLSELEKEIHVQLTAEELVPHFDKAYKTHQAKVEIDGFRKGKAPLEIVKRVYGEAIEYESLDEIANDAYRSIVRENDLHPIGDPVLTDMKFQRGDGMSFTVKYEIAPTVELGEYKGIPVEKPKHTVTEEEIQAEIERIRKSNHTLEEAEEVTDERYVVTVDMQDLDATGMPIIGRRSQDIKIDLSDADVVTEIREALRGVRVNVSRRARFSHEHEDHTTDHHMELLIKHIDRIVLPEVNDEFVKRITKDKVTTVEDFRSKLKDDMIAFWEDHSYRAMVNDLIGEIVKRHHFGIPETLIKGLTDTKIEELRSQAPDKKMPPEFNEEEFRQQFRQVAIFQGKWFLLKEAMISAEKLEVTDDDILTRAEKDAPRMGIEKERLIDFYKTSRQVRDRILTDKLMDLVIGSATITEYEDKPAPNPLVTHA